MKPAQGTAVAAEVPSMYWLFDDVWMNHVCEAVRVNIENLALGYPSSLASVMREQLLKPIDDYMVALSHKRAAAKGPCRGADPGASVL